MHSSVCATETVWLFTIKARLNVPKNQFSGKEEGVLPCNQKSLCNIVCHNPGVMTVCDVYHTASHITVVTVMTTHHNHRTLPHTYHAFYHIHQFIP
jgi:hypothetical protein